MLQLTQKLGSGEMKVLEVPLPALPAGHLLVRTHYSLISAGTEGSTVRTARSSYIGKAKERPQQVRQVIETIRSQGITQTYRAVMKKLDAYSPLGYSCTGEVIAVAPDVTSITIGDLVACGGLSASHAEMVSVPLNLCVRLEPDADLKQAAYNTLGAIALQGVRQADLRLGETCAVIGLGLLGQLVSLILGASGVRTIGIDVDRAMVETARQRGVDLALGRDEDGIEGKIAAFTGGIGCDAVIITAATNSLDPINFAGAIARKRGSVIIVGAVPTGFEREPHYYRKELQVKMSCSYGPGRYDPSYEEKGHDYPAAYVRWTENRNMQAFQELIRSRKIDLGYLTTHTYRLEEAPRAYDMLVERSEPFIGILIEYDREKDLGAVERLTVGKPVPVRGGSSASVGFIGAGSYAQSHLLPNLRECGGVRLAGIVNASGTGTRSVAERFGFDYCAGSGESLLADEAINTLFIATRHDSHAAYVTKALRAGKHVFVEKPLCLSEEELCAITAIHAEQAPHCVLMVGYNRRFSPLARMLRDAFGTGPMAMTYRVNAGAIPAESWIQDPELGGGRIIGEVCHFVDFLTYLNGSLPTTVHATALRATPQLLDTVNLTFTFANGSIGTIGYFANGDKGLPKERVEVFANGCSAVLDDFRTLTIYARGKKREKKLMAQDKGQKAEVEAFIAAIGEGRQAPIPFEEIRSTSLAVFRALESIRSGRCLAVNGDT